MLRLPLCKYFLGFLITVLLLFSFFAQPASLALANAAGPYRTYLPVVARPAACAPSAEEASLANIMRTAPEQQRTSMSCNPILEKVAHDRALDMAQRNYFNHVNPDGLAANALVRQAGYVLPSFYGTAPGDNNIESIAAGYSSAQDVWNGWLSSSAHRLHLLGEHPFYAEQMDYGIARVEVPGSRYGVYWVVITAKPGP